MPIKSLYSNTAINEDGNEVKKTEKMDSPNGSINPYCFKVEAEFYRELVSLNARHEVNEWQKNWEEIDNEEVDDVSVEEDICGDVCHREDNEREVLNEVFNALQKTRRFLEGIMSVLEDLRSNRRVPGGTGTTSSRSICGKDDGKVVCSAKVNCLKMQNSHFNDEEINYQFVDKGVFMVENKIEKQNCGFMASNFNYEEVEEEDKEKSRMLNNGIRFNTFGRETRSALRPTFGALVEYVKTGAGLAKNEKFIKLGENCDSGSHKGFLDHVGLEARAEISAQSQREEEESDGSCDLTQPTQATQAINCKSANSNSAEFPASKEEAGQPADYAGLNVNKQFSLTSYDNGNVNNLEVFKGNFNGNIDGGGFNSRVNGNGNAFAFGGPFGGQHFGLFGGQFGGAGGAQLGAFGAHVNFGRVQGFCGDDFSQMPLPMHGPFPVPIFVPVHIPVPMEGKRDFAYGGNNMDGFMRTQLMDHGGQNGLVESKPQHRPDFQMIKFYLI